MADKTELPIEFPSTSHSEAVPVKAQAENPQPTQANDTSEPNQAPAENSLGAKISGALSGVAEKYGLSFRKGRGRPRKDGTPGKADTVLDPATGEALPARDHPAIVAAVPATPDTTLETLALHKAIVGTVKGLIRWAVDFTRLRSIRAGLNRVFVEKVCADCRPDEADVAEFSESLSEVLKKYNVKTAYAPEVRLALASARMAAPFIVLHMELSAEIKRQRENDENADRKS